MPWPTSYTIPSQPVTLLGQNVPAVPSAAASVTHNTNNAVAGGGKIISCVGWFDAAATTATSFTVGSVTGAIDRQLAAASVHCAIGYADVPALASGQTVTMNFSAGTPDSRYIVSVFVPNLAPGGSITGNSASGASGTAWNSGGASQRMPAFSIGCAFGDGNNSSSTPAANFTEITDMSLSGDSTFTAIYRLTTAPVAPSASGTWAVALVWTALLSHFAFQMPVPPATGMPF